VRGERGVLKNGIDGIEAKTVHPHIEPETNRLPHRPFHIRVAPVQIGLVLEEKVVVVLSGRLIECPGGTAERRIPVIRRTAVGCGVTPDIPVALRVIPARPRLPEPGMLHRRMVEHQIEQHPHTARVGAVEKTPEIIKRSVFRRDAGIVRDVVATVRIRGRIVRREPERPDPQIAQVVESVDHARKVADAVAITVGETARIDLVEHCRLPPCERLHKRFLRWFPERSTVALRRQPCHECRQIRKLVQPFGGIDPEFVQ